MQKEAPRVYSKELVEVLFRLPYTKIAFLESAGLGTRKTVAGYLRTLERIGVLKVERHGRELYYFNNPFLNLLVGK